MSNNPISNVDPDGDLGFLAIVGIGAVTNVFSNGLSNLSQGNSFFSGVGSAALWGGVGAASGYGIGSVFGKTGSFLKELGRAGAHGLSSGVQSELSGGSFGQGILSGSISSGIGSGIDALGGNAGDQILGGGLGGGIGSAISGGNFFDGFGQGIAVGAFNHSLHNFATQLQGPLDPPELKGFPGAEYQGKTKNGRHAWKWKGKWLEWTNKGGGVVEMYDGKTRKKHLGKYDPKTRNRLKPGIKTRFADAIKFGMRRLKMSPIFYFEPGLRLQMEMNSYPTNIKKELH